MNTSSGVIKTNMMHLVFLHCCPWEEGDTRICTEAGWLPGQLPHPAHHSLSLLGQEMSPSRSPVAKLTAFNLDILSEAKLPCFCLNMARSVVLCLKCVKQPLVSTKNFKKINEHCGEKETCETT